MIPFGLAFEYDLKIFKMWRSFSFLIEKLKIHAYFIPQIDIYIIRRTGTHPCTKNHNFYISKPYHDGKHLMLISHTQWVNSLQICIPLPKIH